MDFTGHYNTQLTDAEEAAFMAWATEQNRLADLEDYDLRGLFKSGDGFAENGHGTDQFKKPNHPTFSDQSIYHGKDGFTGGQWSQDELGADVFTPSINHLNMWPEKDLRAYFDKYEPGVNLVIPKQQEPIDRLSAHMDSMGI